eukprot:TRINITY_DN17263_c0_g1_i6.p1 TRINITY_DN17263_c0_g1~~TRINITY_DN17263_c0_g1_i6.p1  ORF type:complete len:609 (-),score=174.33 TRINITY_DN17263_c0_g1_i6:570-2396(-)
MCIRDRYQRRVRGPPCSAMGQCATSKACCEKADDGQTWVAPEALPDPASWWKLSGGRAKSETSKSTYKMYLARAQLPQHEHTEDLVSKDMSRTSSLFDPLVALVMESEGVPADAIQQDIAMVVRTKMAMAGRVLRAVAVRNPRLGYAQEFGRAVVAVVGVVPEEERCFWIICAILEDILPYNLCTADAPAFRGIQILAKVLQARCKDLTATKEVPLEFWTTVATRFIPTLMVGELPTALMIRTVDAMMCGSGWAGFAALFGVALAVIRRFLLRFPANECWDVFKYVSKLPADDSISIMEEAATISPSEIRGEMDKHHLELLRLWNLPHNTPQVREALGALRFLRGGQCADDSGTRSAGQFLDAEQVSSLHEQYLALEPDADGGMSLDQFQRVLVGSVGAHSKWAHVAAPRIFEIFQQYRAISFPDLVMVLVVLGKGSPQEVLELVFRCYDTKTSSSLIRGGDGVLDEAGKNAFVAAMVLTAKQTIYNGETEEASKFFEAEYIKRFEAILDDIYMSLPVLAPPEEKKSRTSTGILGGEVLCSSLSLDMFVAGVSKDDSLMGLIRPHPLAGEVEIKSIPGPGEAGGAAGVEDSMGLPWTEDRGRCCSCFA